MDSFQTQINRRISLWLPESFEYLILKAGIIQSEKLKRILENVSEYVECERYESWERFFTDILIELTDGGVEKYSKDTLNEYYLQEWIIEKIKKQFPEEIKI